MVQFLWFETKTLLITLQCFRTVLAQWLFCFSHCPACKHTRSREGGEYGQAIWPKWTKVLLYDAVLTNKSWVKMKEGGTLGVTAFVFPSNHCMWWAIEYAMDIMNNVLCPLCIHVEYFGFMLFETKFKPLTAISKDGDGSTSEESLSPTHHFGRAISVLLLVEVTGLWRMGKDGQ